jgi:hypothetical protein
MREIKERFLNPGVNEFKIRFTYQGVTNFKKGNE